MKVPINVRDLTPEESNGASLVDSVAHTSVKMNTCFLAKKKELDGTKNESDVLLFR